MSQSEVLANEDFQTDAEEQRVLLAALDSFYQYGKVAHFNTTHTRRQAFYALPREHWEMLAAPPFNYLETLNAVDDALDKNAELSLAIYHSAIEAFGISITSTPDEWRGKATSNDMEKARSTLRQLYRDWSSEGASEREVCYGRVLDALLNEKSRIEENMRVLVPGAGLGRLVFDLCHAGFDAEGNEISYHQLMASSYILNHVGKVGAHTLFPWVHSFSNHLNRQNHLKSVSIPDVHCSTALASVAKAGQMSMSASDFLLLYGNAEHKDSFDAVATVFFLDTAPNVIRYLETIRSCLRIGGLLVNIGPLLWHFENNAPGRFGQEDDDKGHTSSPQGIADPGAVELTNDELLLLVEKSGFQIEHTEFEIPSPYIHDATSMLHNTYRASFWVARKI